MSWREKTVAALRARAATRPVHGSEARDLLIEHGAGACADSYTAESVLTEALVPLDTTAPRPTLSQRAFASLQFRTHPGFVAGCKEHFYWGLKSS